MTLSAAAATTRSRLSLSWLRRCLAKVSRADWWGLAFVVVFAALFLSPALKDGMGFGPADIGAGLSQLTNHVFPVGNHNVVNGDIIDQTAPWNLLNWHLVHSGELPLWNSYAGTGLPQLLNFESAPASLPALVSYLLPASWSTLVVMAMKLLIAGVGTYLFVRLLGVAALGAAFAGVTYMLSGAFSGWLGWAITGPLCWAGFFAAAMLYAYRRPQRLAPIAALAVVVAFVVYGGQPESDALFLAGFALFFVAAVAVRLLRGSQLDPRGLWRVAGGLVGGLCLSAPLWLPGLSVLRHSARASKFTATGVPPHAIVDLFAQGFFGLPIKGSAYFGSNDYYETAAYVGVIALVFAAVALCCAWRRAAVIGSAIAVLGGLALVYDLGPLGAPVQRLVQDVGLHAVALQRMLVMVDFFVAVLAGIGIEICRQAIDQRRVLRIALAATTACLVVLAVMWLKVDSAQFLPGTPAIGTGAAALRSASLWWPTGEVLALFVVLAGAFLAKTPPSAKWRSGVLSGLLVLQGGFLLFAGVGLNSYAKDAYPVTPAVATLREVVGDHLVGLDGPNLACPAPIGPYCGVRLWEGFGLYPEINVAYSIDELAMHDPVIPAAYFSSWPVPNAGQVFSGNLNLFVPAIDSVALARRYGVSYVIVPLGAVHAPPGMTKVAVLVPAAAHQSAIDLYAVPGSSQFSFDSSSARVLTVTHPSDRRYNLAVSVPRPSELELRVTDVSGWHASADGAALALHSVDGVFFEALVPAGTTTVTLTYWPRGLDEGLALALAAVVVMAVVAVIWRRRRQRIAPV